MLILTQRLGTLSNREANDTLSLDAEARSRSRQHLQLDSGEPAYLRLPRGTVLQDGDCLASEQEDTMVRVVAKPESVITVKANRTGDLVKAAYHLGNRHVSLEIASDYLRLSTDPVLEDMLKQMGLNVVNEVTPFFPEAGAYNHHH